MKILTGKHGKHALTYKRDGTGTPRTHSSTDWSLKFGWSTCSRKFSQMPHLQMRSLVWICLVLYLLEETECWARIELCGPSGRRKGSEKDFLYVLFSLEFLMIKGRMVRSREMMLNLMWLFICLVLHSAPPVQGMFKVLHSTTSFVWVTAYNWDHGFVGMLSYLLFFFSSETRN